MMTTPRMRVTRSPQRRKKHAGRAAQRGDENEDDAEAEDEQQYADYELTALGRDCVRRATLRVRRDHPAKEAEVAGDQREHAGATRTTRGQRASRRGLRARAHRTR